MKIKSLLAFHSTVAEGSAAAAARHLNISQPAISRLILALEHDLGFKLFYRTRQRLILSEDGAAFYRDAERILAGLKDMTRIAHDIRARRPRGLHLVTMPRATTGWVAPAVAAFRAAHPTTPLSIDVQRRNDMELWQAARNYHLGIGVLPARNATIETKPMLRARACAVVAKDHPLARQSRVEVQDLKPWPIIGLSPGLLPREQSDDVFRSAGLVPEYAMETSATQLACNLAGLKQGIVITDPISAACDAHRVDCIPIEPAKWMLFGLLLPRPYHHDPAIAAFVEALAHIARELEASTYVQCLQPP